MGARRNRAIRIGKWKLVAKGANGAWELYDLDADRSELNNLASIQEDRAKEMAEKWEAWAIAAKANPGLGIERRKIPSAIKKHLIWNIIQTFLKTSPQ